MDTKIIVSYDDTIYDVDALALGRVLGTAGATVALAYVRHVAETEAASETQQRAHAERLLAHGAEWLGDSDAERHIVLSASTGVGLAELAKQQGASIVVFGADYRTAPGLVQPGTTAERLLNGGHTALALAPAGFRKLPSASITSVAIAAAEDDEAARETAVSLAHGLDAKLTDRPGPGCLLVVGSRREATRGRVLVSAANEYAIDTASFPVLIVPRGVAVRFGAAAAVA